MKVPPCGPRVGTDSGMEQIKGAMALNDCESGHEEFKSNTSKYDIG